MKFSKIAMALLVSSVIFTGCGSDDEKDTSTKEGSSQQNQQNIEEQEANERMGDVTKKNRGVMLWNYKLDHPLNSSDIPAIDEQGNIYFSVYSIQHVNKKDEEQFTVTSLDKNGKKRWSKTFEHKGGSVHIMYSNNQIFFTTGLIGLQVYALNASTGEVNWSREEEQGMLGSYAIANNTLYMGMKKISQSSFLVSYDLENGQEKDRYQLKNDNELLYSMSLFNNHIYLLKDDCLLRVDDVDDKMTKSWEICSDSFMDKDSKDNHESSRMKGIAKIAIDSQENIYFQGNVRTKEKEYVTNYSIDKYGEFRWRKKMYTSHIPILTGLTIDKDDNLYSSVTGNRMELGYLYSLSSDGDERWRLDNAYFDETKILEMGYQNSPTIASNGNIYNKYGLNSVKKSGTLDWKHQNDTGELTVSDYSTINTDGNIISIGIKEIACYKGDATTVEPNGWSKLYGNAGNTSSR